MAKFYDAMNEELCDFMRRQHVFFVATAPVSGRINLSPKGMNTFRCLDDSTVAYLDLTGSGNETSAHLLENGRMTIMFCSFDENPRILRLYGHGRVVHPRDGEWQRLLSLFDDLPGKRQIIIMNISHLQTSCGFAVPLYEYQGERETLLRWAENKGEPGIRDYWRDRNQVSIDGLPTRIVDGY
ncbi:MAG: pyridoxamine 5'-phosphate oxidase family protein [Gammaproteobacteria bacterium]|nr:pyridoxamine 5'-phosphate oxidase family protein [Gammaproteobacteria bacterium]